MPEELHTPFHQLISANDQPREEKDAGRARFRLHQALLIAALGALAGSLATTFAFLHPRQLPLRDVALASRDDDEPPSSLARCSGHSGVKEVVCSMDHALVSLSTDWTNYTLFHEAMAPFWDHGFRYVPMYGIDPSSTMRGWYDNEMQAWTNAFPWVSFTQMIFLGSGQNASSTTYAVGTWEQPLGILAPSKRRMTVRITDFYRAGSDGKIATNWMLIDVLDLLRQQGKTPLPLSPLPQGRVSPPQGESVPAPMGKFANSVDADVARRVVSAALQADWVDGSVELLQWDPALTWYGPVPFGLASGNAAFLVHFLHPLHTAFARRHLNIDVLACEGFYCAAHGTFSGDHVGRWLGQPATGRRLHLDFGMHYRVDPEAQLILEGWAIFDLPRMFLGLGIDLLREEEISTSSRGHAQLTADTSKAPAETLSAGAEDTSDLPAPEENNECSNAYAHPPAGPKELDCPAFVIRSTDATWHARDWDQTNTAVNKYFSEDWQSVRAFGMMLNGREALRDFMRDWLGGFPDVYIHVADVFCEGNDEVGYKTTMPYVLTATHSGYTKAFGPPSGNKVKYHGIANCYIKQNTNGQWQYTREWDLPDMWSFITALNLTTAQLPHPSTDLVPVDKCKPLFDWISGEMNWFPPGDVPSARRLHRTDK